MSSAKPQSSPDASDDLIAELARLMAQDAQTDQPESPAKPEARPTPGPVLAASRATPVALKSEPLPSDAPQSAAPQTAVASKPAAPAQAPQPSVAAMQPGPRPVAPVQTVRIPGGDLPPQPAAQQSAAPSNTPPVVPEPVANWPERFARQTGVPPAAPRSEVRQEPRLSPTPAAVAPEPKVPEPRATFVAPAGTAAGVRAEPTLETPPRPVAATPARPAQVVPEFDFNDTIASLIAADAREAEEAKAAAAVEDATSGTAPEPVRATPTTELSVVEPEPASLPVVAVAQPEPEAEEVIHLPGPIHAEPTNRPAVQVQPQPVAQPVEQRSRASVVRPVQPVEAKAPSDKFVISPVFGVGTKAAAPRVAQAETTPRPEPSAERVVPEAVRPQPQAPRVEARQPDEPQPTRQPRAETSRGSDPIAELEGLIGAAARQDNRRISVARPALADEPSLRETLEPEPAKRNRWPGRREPQLDSDRSAEDAILAAAAINGTVDRLDDFEPAAQDEKRGRRTKPVRVARQRRSIGRALVGPMAAVLLLAAGGGGLYWTLNMGRDSGTAPVLTADSTPAKQAPTEVATADPAQRSVVFDEIDGVNQNDQPEQLVSRDQADSTTVAAATPPEASAEGLANRKVRTVTVRPDGTIVSTGEDTVAGTSELPVDRPNVPALPETSVDASDLLASAAQSNQPAPTLNLPTGSLPAAPVNALAAPTAANANSAGNGQTIESLVANTDTAPTALTPEPVVPAITLAPGATPTPEGTVAPVPMPPLTNRSALAARQKPAAPAATPVAAATPATQQPAQVAAVAPKPTSNAPAYVQLASQNDEATAQRTVANLQSRFGGIFKGVPLEIQRVDLGAKGTKFRVRMPANSLGDAQELCRQIKAQGGDCLAIN